MLNNKIHCLIASVLQNHSSDFSILHDIRPLWSTILVYGFTQAKDVLYYLKCATDCQKSSSDFSILLCCAKRYFLVRSARYDYFNSTILSYDCRSYRLVRFYLVRHESHLFSTTSPRQAPSRSKVLAVETQVRLLFWIIH